MKLIFAKDALLAAQIVLMRNGARGATRYMAMVEVAKPKGTRGAVEAESFDTPCEALDWLRSKIDGASLPPGIKSQ